MEIPRYWAYTRIPYKVPSSAIGSDVIWRSSEVSVEDAQDKADQALERWKEHVRNQDFGKSIRYKYLTAIGFRQSGGYRESGIWHKTLTTIGDKERIDSYPYAVSPREKVLEEINGASGQVQAFLSRNGGGSVVLNVADVMFLDWDVQEPSLFDFIAKYEPIYFRKKDRLTEFDSIYQVKKLKPIIDFVQENENWSIRMYKTAGGYRGLVTHRLFDPASDEVSQLMEQWQCDPMYLKLCRKQESFRARLTPKGTRINLWSDLSRHCFRPWLLEEGWLRKEKKGGVLTKALFLSRHCFRYPWLPDDKAAAEEYDNAVELYEQLRQSFATCRYIGTLGRKFIHDDVAPILEIHDRWALDEANKPLA